MHSVLQSTLLFPRKIKLPHTVVPILCCLLITGYPAQATDDPTTSESTLVEAGEAFWQSRARGFDAGQIDAEPIQRAIDAWERALASDPDSLELRFRLMEAQYFKGHFVLSGTREKRQVFSEMVELSEETLARAALANDPSILARGHFWAAVSWGLWAMNHSYVAAGARGVAGRIRRHAEAVIDLDPEFADGGGYRLLGRLHSATPQIPLFTGWIDRQLGIHLLRTANSISDRDARNPLFLAQALLDQGPDSRREAIGLLREVSSRTPDRSRLVEESETIAEARRTLELAGEAP